METALLMVVMLAAAAAGQAAAPAEPAQDLATGAVDPYDCGGERLRFFRAAGVDNELDANEFAAARGKPDSFVRPFDRWERFLAHDKDQNGTIDWFEADACRGAVRQGMLDAFDADKDRQLKGPERDKANAALASGRLPGDPEQRPAKGKFGDGERPLGRKGDPFDGNEQRKGDVRSGPGDRRLPSKEPSGKAAPADGGQLSKSEKKAFDALRAGLGAEAQDQREQAEQRGRKKVLKQGGDGHGKLSNKERRDAIDAIRKEKHKAPSKRRPPEDKDKG